MNTHESYVSLETAKLLKKAGFYWDCYELYEREYEQDGRTRAETSANWNSTSKYYSAPTLDVAQRWLREVKNFMVETTFITDEHRVIYQANLYEVVPEKGTGIVSELISVVKGQSELKRTYEEAQEAGIKKALEIILEKGE